MRRWPWGRAPLFKNLLRLSAMIELKSTWRRGVRAISRSMAGKLRISTMPKIDVRPYVQ